MSKIEISQEEIQNKISEENARNKLNFEKEEQYNQDCENCTECNCEEEELEDRDYSKDEVEEIIQNVANQVANELLPNIQLDLSDIQDFKLNRDRFSDGINEISKLCGMFVGLKNVGVPDETIQELLINQQTIDYNEIANRETNNNNLEMAKIQSINNEKNMI